MPEPYHHANLRNELISEGLKMLSRDGIASFSLRRLSQELGVSHAAAYRHFPSKEDLLRSILVESSRRFRVALETSVAPGTTGKEALMQLGTGYIRFFLAHPEGLALFSLIPAADNVLSSILNDRCFPSDFSKIEQIPELESFAIFRNIAMVMQTEAPYTDLTEREILLGFWGKVHGIACILVTQKNFIPAEELDAVIEKVVRTAF